MDRSLVTISKFLAKHHVRRCPKDGCVQTLRNALEEAGGEAKE